MSIPVPLPRVAAFEKLGFGLFVHWGLYSQIGEGEWVQRLHHYDGEEYAKLQNTFTAEDFDAEELARFAHDCGIRYIVLTTRHHDGFSLYDTCGLNDYDAPHSPAKRDLVAEFVAGCRKYDVVPFFYHTTIDWHWHGKHTKEMPEDEFQEYLDYLIDSVEILCRNYGKIGGLWFDGNWARPQSDWQEDRLYGMIRKYQPDAIIVNNSGLEALGKEGHPELDSVTFENNVARPMNRDGKSKYIAAEVCRTMNHHWGRSCGDFDFMSPGKAIELLSHSRGCGANFLLNIGPDAQGAVPDYERALLTIVGKWCKLNGEALYRPVPASFNCKGRDFMLRDGKNYYYFVFEMGVRGDDNVTAMARGLGTRCIDNFSEEVISAEWLDNGETVPFFQDLTTGALAVQCAGYRYGHNLVVRVMKLVCR